MVLLKVSLVLLLLICSSFSGDIALRIGGGLNLSSTSQEAPKGKSKSMGLGTNGGVDFVYGVTNEFAAVSGLSFETRGEKIIDDKTDEETSFKISYLNIPFFLQFNSFIGPGVLNLLAGPEAGFLIFADRDDGKVSRDAKDKFKVFDLGLTIGIGYTIPIGLGGIMIQPSYDFGLLQIQNDFVLASESAQNRNIKIKIAWVYNLSSSSNWFE